MHQVRRTAPWDIPAQGAFLSLLLRELKSSDFALICAAAVILLPKEKSVDKAVWPVSHSVEVPAPRMGAQSLVRPSFLAEGAGDKHISELVERDSQLMDVMP